MKRKSSQKFTDNFKREAVNLVVEQGYTIRHPDTDWKNVFGEVNANDFDRIHDRFSPEKFSASERKMVLFAAEKGVVHHITTVCRGSDAVVPHVRF